VLRWCQCRASSSAFFPDLLLSPLIIIVVGLLLLLQFHSLTGAASLAARWLHRMRLGVELGWSTDSAWRVARPCCSWLSFILIALILLSLFLCSQLLGWHYRAYSTWIRSGMLSMRARLISYYVLASWELSCSTVNCFKSWPRPVLHPPIVPPQVSTLVATTLTHVRLIL